MRVPHEAHWPNHLVERRIRVGRTLDVVEELGSVQSAVRNGAMLEVLDESDDVQRVVANFEVSDEAMANLQA